MSEKAINLQQANTLYSDLRERVEDNILVQGTEPTEPANKLWIDDSAGQTCQVPTYAEHQALSNVINGNESKIETLEKRSARKINTTKRRPLMTFIDDDACSQFADIWGEICEDKGIRVSCAVISSLVGDSTHLSWSQIESMHSAGTVEFVNHTQNHVALANKTKTEVYSEVTGCIDDLKAHGIDTGDLIVYPFGQYDENAIDAIRGVARCGVTTDKGSEITYNVPPVATFCLWRNELVETDAANNPSLEWMKSAVDAAVDNNAWIIWMTHSQYAGFTSAHIENIETMIDYAVEKGVEIVTLGDGLDAFGNVIETGDYKNQGKADGLVVGCDGTSYGRGANYEEKANKYLFHTPASRFPRHNIIASAINGAYGLCLPGDGLLISAVEPTTFYELTLNSFQIFKQAGELYQRRMYSADGLPNDFILLTQTGGTSTNRPKRVKKGYCYCDTTRGKPIFASTDAQSAWYKLVITSGTNSAGETKFAGTKVALDAGMTKEEVRDAVAEAFIPLRTQIPYPGLAYFYPEELGFEDDGLTLYLVRTSIVDYTNNLWVDPVQPDTGCRGTYTRLRDGVAPTWVDATGTSV